MYMNNFNYIYFFINFYITNVNYKRKFSYAYDNLTLNIVYFNDNILLDTKKKKNTKKKKK